MIYVVIWLLCGLTAAVIYRQKGRSGAVAFVVGVILGPIGVLLAALSSADKPAIEAQQLATGAARKCPHCGELVRPEATVCRHCQRELAPPAPPPAGAARKQPGADGQGWTCSACGGFVRPDATSCKHCQASFVAPVG